MDSTRRDKSATLQGSVLIIVESPLALSVLGHEDVIALSVNNLCLHEVVQDHSSSVVWNISNLLCLSSKLGFAFIKPSHFGSHTVLIRKL